MKKLFNWLLPPFVRLPLILAVLTNMAAYYLVPILLGPDTHRYDLTVALDVMLPFVPFFLLFYVLAYLQWGCGYVFHCRDSVQLCYRMVSADIIAKLLCLLLFVFLPTQIDRPEITVTGFWEWGTQFIYDIDKPINLFPSIHCLESWMCFRTAMMLQKKNGWYITAQGILTVLVMASTVLLKQHYVVDIPAGILAAEIGLFLSGRCGLWRLMRKLETPSVRRALAAQETVSQQL